MKQTARSGRRRPGRDPYLDNAKYLTIVLVAVGHAWAPLTADSRVASALYYLLYTFHMPAFIVVSGYLSRGFEGTPRQIKRLVTGVLVPYLVFQTLYALHIRHTADPDRELRYQEPGFALWFLVALFLWRLTTPLWKVLRHPLPVAVAVGVAASVTPSIDDDLSLMRVAQFLPFFVLGLQLRPDHFDALRRRPVRLLALPVAVCALLVSYAAVPFISAAPFLHDQDAQGLGLPAWAGGLMTLGSFACALVMTGCFLAWVPRRRTWFTALGAGTLCAYLLHIFPVQLSQHLGWYETAWTGSPLARIGITVFAGAAMTGLCTAPVRRTVRWVLEPGMGWFFGSEANSGAKPPGHAPPARTAELSPTGGAPGASPDSPAAGAGPSGRAEPTVPARSP
ncbi:acyltransferase family protein [Streptomyces ovatisporus]|uniref:Acyltransferase family protein n=1 Tax=Streptomyces ovatisporus TaxID=1128682 RepID=A0ABV9A2T2_9ACTN